MCMYIYIYICLERAREREREREMCYDFLQGISHARIAIRFRTTCAECGPGPGRLPGQHGILHHSIYIYISLYVTLCYVMLCYVMLCYVMLYDVV